MPLCTTIYRVNDRRSRQLSLIYNNFCVTKIKYNMMYDVQDYSDLYFNTVRPIMCES